MAKAKADNPLQHLFVHALKDIYFAENAIYKALPKMIDGSEHPELKTALTTHRKETEGQIKRLEQIFDLLGLKAESTPCEAIKGILKEGEEVLEKFGDTDAGDASVIFGCQAVEHYEINRYGTMREWANELGMADISKLLSQTLAEERNADEKLTDIAEESINIAAEGKRQPSGAGHSKGRASDTRPSRG
jgi:ferritin-like metal-binding protein YciE